MSFRIFAAGSTATGGPFNVSRSGLDIGDVYEAVEAFAAMGAAHGTARLAREGGGAAVESVVSDQVVERVSVTSPQQQGIAAQGRITGAEQLRDSLVWLLANCAPLNLFIAVQGESTLLSGTPTGSVRLRFVGGEHAAATRLFGMLNPVLDRCGLNSFGVLMAMARVMDAYEVQGGGDVHGDFHLNIDVAAT